MEWAAHSHTPRIVSVDPRGHDIRFLRYARRDAADDIETRTECAQRDVRGHLVALRDARLVTPNARIIRSLSGKPVQRISVDAGMRLRLFDPTGQDVAAWSGRGSTFRSEYDGQLRPIARYECLANETECCVERFVYGGPGAGGNGCGRLLSHNDPSGCRTWADHDLHGHPAVETRRFLRALAAPGWPEDETGRDAVLEPHAFTTVWRRDALGSVTVQKDAGGHVRRTRYGLTGLPATVRLNMAGSESEQELLCKIAYDPSDLSIAYTMGNGATMSGEYDPATGRLRRRCFMQPDGRIVRNANYTYDPAGHVVRIVDAAVPVRYWQNRRTDGVSTFVYDSLDQLILATGRESSEAVVGPGLPAWSPVTNDTPTPYTQEYDYDTGGNLIRLRHIGVQKYTRNLIVAATSNRALAADGDSLPDWSASFDAHGNPQWLQKGQALRWTARDQLQEVGIVSREEGIGDTECYVYSGDGLRVRKIRRLQAQRVHTAEVRYLPGLEWRIDTLRGERFEVLIVPVGADHVQVLHWNEGRPGNLPNDALHYTVADHLGSATLVLDAAAALISAETYYPYGGTAWRIARHNMEADYRTIRCFGRERDATGLISYPYRLYVPWLQRWLNPDPGGEIDGFNLFWFVRNDPVGAIDPDGRMYEQAVDTRGIDSRTGEQAFQPSPMSLEEQLTLIAQRDPSIWGMSSDQLGVMKEQLITRSGSPELAVELALRRYRLEPMNEHNDFENWSQAAAVARRSNVGAVARAPTARQEHRTSRPRHELVLVERAQWPPIVRHFTTKDSVALMRGGDPFLKQSLPNGVYPAGVYVTTLDPKEESRDRISTAISGNSRFRRGGNFVKKMEMWLELDTSKLPTGTTMHKVTNLHEGTYVLRPPALPNQLPGSYPALLVRDAVNKIRAWSASRRSQ